MFIVLYFKSFTKQFACYSEQTLKHLFSWFCKICEVPAACVIKHLTQAIYMKDSRAAGVKMF